LGAFPIPKMTKESVEARPACDSIELMAPRMARCPEPAEPASTLESELVSLYREHASGLSRYAESFARNQAGAREAVQEIFLRYFIERRYGRHIDNPRAWLYFVLHSNLLDHQPAASAATSAAPLAGSNN
jgi:sigma-70-like protein